MFFSLLNRVYWRFRYDALCILLRHSKNVRYWFAHNVLFAYPNRFSEYLLECPSAEVRGAFSKLIVFIAHFSLQDGPCPTPIASPGPSSQVCDFSWATISIQGSCVHGKPGNNLKVKGKKQIRALNDEFSPLDFYIICPFFQGCDNLSLSEHLFRAVLNLLRREVSEHGRHLQQYFNLFVMYANLGKCCSPFFNLSSDKDLLNGNLIDIEIFYYTLFLNYTIIKGVVPTSSCTPEFSNECLYIGLK